MKISLIGYGYWGKNWARLLSNHPQIELSAVCDLDENKRPELAQKYPQTKFYTSPQQLLADKPRAVIISTPVSSHFELAKFFLQNKVNVLCEKPLSTSPDEVNELKKLVDDSSLCLMVGHVFEFNKAVQKIKQLVTDDALGEILYVHSSRCGLGPIRKDVNVIADLATHDIAIFNYLFEELPTAVNANASNFFDSPHEDAAHVHLNYSKSMSAHINVSWVEAKKERLLKVVGRKKMLIFDDTNTVAKIQIIDKGVSYIKDDGDFGSFQLSVVDGDIHIPKIENAEPLQLELAHFIECLETGQTPHSDVNSAWRVAVVLSKIQEALGRK